MNEPTCPKGCQVATPPEPVQGRPHRYACTACGTEFTWQPSPITGDRYTRSFKV